ncbi:signal peptide peptidase SppA [Salisediminibacterium halotolerans]|uniref:Protease-4 n=1 Tax=Salisediminibacterium halotolerans TaxID=517425 RepID=A0A1H9V603_9BACI|nr:signal peptide peptidase SppA [Salisediminibacterium haloalkalitolerans]SES17270.1 protease-4 [Salisediminibacterium haloalkalitolerans]
MTGKRWIALGVAAVLFLFSTVFTVVTQQFGSEVDDFIGAQGMGVNEETMHAGTDAGKIAVVHIEGMLQDTGGDDFFSVGYNHSRVLNQLDRAAEDGEVHGVVLRVNTPGGGVVESDEIHDRVQAIQDDYGKPVYVSMGSQAASGGYYISAPAEKIFANGQTFTGSLGVILQSFNVSELAEDLGIEAETFTSGEHKDFLSPFSESNEGEQEIAESIIDDAYEQFIDVIDDGRENLTRDEVYELADGRIYTGNQAAENGLIDDTGHLEDAVDSLQEDLDRGDLSVVEYVGGSGMPSLFGFAQQLFPGSEQRQLEYILQDNDGPELMYLYTE